MTFTNGDSLPPCFVDTNILVYAYAGDDPKRSPAAQHLVEGLTRAGLLRTSTQVLQELFATLTRKGGRRVTEQEALNYMDGLVRNPVTALDYPIIREAGLLSHAHSLSFWDSLIVVAAARSGARRLYSEDLQHGRKILGVEIVNPFRD